VRKKANLTQAEMAPLMGMSLSGYRKWEQGQRRISGPAAALLYIIQKEPAAVKRALAS
jgi:putative transcriptional regulator